MFWFKKKKKEAEKSYKSMAIDVTNSGINWSDQDFYGYISEAFLKNIIAYKAIDKIAQAAMSVDWKPYSINSKGKREEVLNTPINNILKRANPQQSFKYLTYATTVYYLLAGNNYIEKVAPTSGPNTGIAKELYVLRPDLMQIETDEGRISGYKYNNKTLFPVDTVTGKSDIWHLKKFHPTNDLYGLSTVQPASREIDSSNFAIDWNMRLLQNEARPGMILTVSGMMSDDQYERLKQSTREMKEGPTNVGKTLLVQTESGTIDAKPYSLSPKDMDFIEGSRENARKIALGFGIPPQILGIPGDSTYSNFKEARLSFWEDTVIPYLSYFRDEFNNWIFPAKSNVFIDYDLEKIPAISDKRKDLWKSIETISYLTINEKRELIGYEMVEGGELLYMPANLLPLGFEDDSSDDENDSEEETGDDET